MLIERIEVRLLDLPLVEPFAAAHGTTSSREIVVARIETDGGPGWGECSALPEPTYTDEFAAGAFTIIDEELAPRVLGRRFTATAIGARLAIVPRNPMAKAAIEMALLDAELRAEGTSLADRIGPTATTVAAGAAIGLAPPDAVVGRAEALAAEGFGRIKLKIQPGHDLAVVVAVREHLPDLDVQVDANGAYRPDQIGLLAELAATGVTAIEQPFDPGHPEAAAELVAMTEVPIVADEAADSVETVDRLRRGGALSGVAIKPPRIGGVGPAVELHDACARWNLAATAGGMVETGLGRHALAAVAALPAFSLTGDLSPARRWLRADPWPDLTMTDGRIVVPTGPGVAPDPDPETLERFTVRRSEVRA